MYGLARVGEPAVRVLVAVSTRNDRRLAIISEHGPVAAVVGSALLLFSVTRSVRRWPDGPHGRVAEVFASPASASGLDDGRRPGAPPQGPGRVAEIGP